MKNNRYFKLLTATVIAATPLLWSACSDQMPGWDEHYNPNPDVANAKSLLYNISQDKDLAPFCRVLQATGYDQILDQPNSLTVFAPVITDQQATELIDLYNAEKARTNKDDDNKVIKQFIQNHISRYPLNVSEGSESHISMLNSKYMVLSGTTATTGTLKNPAGIGSTFSNKIVCNNGFVYKADNRLDFYNNIREYMDAFSQYSDVNKYFAAHDYYSLNESASVPGGIVNGETVYLDSVTVIYNPLESYFNGYINHEDSSYLFVAPTNQVYQSLYAQYKPYFTYQSKNLDPVFEDSITNKYILDGRFINMNSGHNQHPSDSLVNTFFSQYQRDCTRDERANVYYADVTGEFFGRDKLACSNGFIISDDAVRTGTIPNSGLIAKEKIFFRPIHIQAERTVYYEIDKDATTGDNLYNARYTTAYDSVTTKLPNPLTGEMRDTVVHFNVSESAFLEVSQNKKTNDPVSVKFKAPQYYSQTLANVPYNIYFVTVPAIAADGNATDTLATRFDIIMKVTNVDGTVRYFDGKEYQTKATTKLMNPTGCVERSTKGEYIEVQPWDEKKPYFVTRTNVVDTIMVAQNIVFPTAGLESSTGDGFEMTVSSFYTNTYKKYYSPSLRIDQIILVPVDPTMPAMDDELMKAATRKD